MAQYEEGQIEFAILSLVRDPLLELIPALGGNMKAVAMLSARLDALKPDWHEFSMSTSTTNGESDGLANAPNLVYGITQEVLDEARLPEEVLVLCASDVVMDIDAHRQRLITTQAELRMSIREELQSDQTDEDRATARSRDYGAGLQNFVRMVRTKRAAMDALPAVPA